MNLARSVSVVVLMVAIVVAIGGCGTQTVASKRSAVGQVKDEVIHVSALLQASPDRTFAYFTDNALLGSWLAAAADVEPKVGGKYELYWEPNDRENNSTIGCRITALAPAQFLAFQWRSPKQFKSFANTADPLTHVTVMFRPEGTGTRVHLLHSGWRNSPRWEEARVWQERAWSGAFMELERTVKR